MEENEYQLLKKKIEKEYPLRCKLATLAGFKANSKNPRALMDTEFDLGIRELFLEIEFRKPENKPEALDLIRKFYSA